MGHGVLSEDRHAQGVHHLGNAVVNLGIDVIGASCQHDAGNVVLSHVGQGALAHLADVVMEDLVLLEPLGNSLTGLLNGHPVLGENLGQPLSELVRVGQGEEGGDELDVLLAQALHVGTDDFGVGGDDRAVEMGVGVGHADLLETDAGVEDSLDAALHEIFHVTVVEFGGVADVLAGDGLHALLEQGMGGAPRDHDAVAQG